MVIEQFEPFVNDYGFFENMGVKIYDNGHSYTGVNYSIHSRYSVSMEYESAMIGAYGEERAQRDPRRGAAQHGLLSESHDQGRHSGHSRGAAARAGRR